MAPGRKQHRAPIANFVYEIGIHRHTPRAGFWLLGSGRQSLAEHAYRVAYIAYVLAKQTPRADPRRAVLMALFHDIGEGRTGDHNYAQQRYGRLAESQAVADIAQSLPFGAEIAELYAEEQAKQTLEARLVKDADSLEWIASLREEEIKGNQKARVWAKIAQKRLLTSAGKTLAKELFTTHPDDWWFNASDEWWVSRNQKDRTWKR